MPSNCCVKYCVNRGSTNTGITFHRIPKCPDRRRKWLSAIRRADPDEDDDLFVPCSYRVCSAHFVTGLPVNDKDHPDYAPSLCLNYTTATSSSCRRASSCDDVVADSSRIRPLATKSVDVVDDFPTSRFRVYRLGKRKILMDDNYNNDVIQEALELIKQARLPPERTAARPSLRICKTAKGKDSANQTEGDVNSAILHAVRQERNLRSKLEEFQNENKELKEQLLNQQQALQQKEGDTAELERLSNENKQLKKQLAIMNRKFNGKSAYQRIKTGILVLAVDQSQATTETPSPS